MEKKKRLEVEKQELSLLKIRLQAEIDNLKAFSKDSKEERERKLQDNADKRAQLEKDVEELKNERTDFEKKERTGVLSFFSVWTVMRLLLQDDRHAGSLDSLVDPAEPALLIPAGIAGCVFSYRASA